MIFKLSLSSGLAVAMVAIFSVANAQDGALIRCGASAGQSYFFKDDVFTRDRSNWEEDGISSGKIVLIKLGEEYDILFDDAAGAYGYREDGAAVISISQIDQRQTIGAFHATYTDIFTFDFENEELVWSSHKIGTLIKKVGIYQADCSVTRSGRAN